MLENEELTYKCNVFYDSYHKLTTNYAGTIDIWAENFTVGLYDTDETIGIFKHSDIIIKYDKDLAIPYLISERIYRYNYSFLEWFKLTRRLKHKAKVVGYELGFNIQISFNVNYIDYVHYKEEWWLWVLKKSQQ